MVKKEFTIVYLSRLKIDDLHSLSKSTIEFADPVKENIGVMPNAILVELKTESHEMELHMNKATRNVLTPQVTEMNADREDRYSEIKRNVTTALKGRNEEKKAAASNLKVFFDPYWDTYKKSLNTKTGIFNGLLSKFEENEMLQTCAATIGITEMMGGLAESNAAFNEVYQIRLVQEAAAEGPAASSLRAAVTNSYEQFCTSIEQAVNYLPSEVLLTLFNQMDELRKTYARLIHDEEEPEPEPPEAPEE